jgi:hypothetical protein
MPRPQITGRIAGIPGLHAYLSWFLRHPARTPSPPPGALLLSWSSPHRRVPSLPCSLHQPEAEALARRPRSPPLPEAEVLLSLRDPAVSPPPILSLAPPVLGLPVVKRTTSSPASATGTAAFLSIWRRQGSSLPLMGHIRIQRRQEIRFVCIIASFKVLNDDVETL